MDFKLNDVVYNNGSSYICIQDHTAAAINEPGVGASWLTFWDILALAGTNGTSGTNATAGTGGTSGTDGTAGTSGTSATDGTSGTSGTNGSRGESFEVDASGELTEAIMTTLEGLGATPNDFYVYLVTVDNRTVKTGPDELTSDMSKHVIMYDGTSWHDYGQFTGLQGVDGTSGSGGTSGTDGTAGTGGTSGTDGTAGTSGTDGTAGTAGSGGTSGTNGTAGSGGTSGTDGTAGSGGTAGTSGLSLIWKGDWSV